MLRVVDLEELLLPPPFVGPKLDCHRRIPSVCLAAVRAAADIGAVTHSEDGQPELLGDASRQSCRLAVIAVLRVAAVTDQKRSAKLLDPRGSLVDEWSIQACAVSRFPTGVVLAIQLWKYDRGEAQCLTHGPMLSKPGCVRLRRGGEAGLSIPLTCCPIGRTPTADKDVESSAVGRQESYRS